MAITYVSSNARPSDNEGFGGSANNSLLINAVGAATGDLVVVIAQYRAPTTIEVDETGGQTWNTLAPFIDAANQCQVYYFWCRWSDETANGNNPNFYANGSAGVPFSCSAHIFRPTAGTNNWGIDAALSSTQFVAPSTPFTVSRTGVTTTNANTVTIASWHTADVNTWDSLAGTGWVSLGDPYNRNTTGSTQSTTRAYRILSAAGATGSVSKNQATNGGDAGVTGIIAFYEFAPGFSLTVNTASYAFTGSAINLLIARKVSIAAGSYAFTGNAIGLRINRTLPVFTGSYAFTGNTVGLRISRMLSVTTGAYTFTGINNSLLIYKLLALSVSESVMTAQAVALKRSLRLIVNTASITATFNQVGFSRTNRLVLSPLALHFTGNAINLVSNSIGLSVNTLSCTATFNPVTLTREAIIDQIIAGIGPAHPAHFH